MTITGLATVAIITTALSVQQQPIRDGERQPTTGTASVAGTVVTDEAVPHAVRRAIVTLSGAELIPSRSTVTDDDGRFAIAGLPAGRFTLTATRASFITSAYGAKRPGRPGTAIAVGDGARVTDVTVRLWRGAAIEGTLRDDRGAPAEGITVTAVPARLSWTQGIFTLSNNGTTTNEAGEFRIFGLEPGTYVVVARPGSAVDSQLIALADAEVDAALDALRRRGAPIASPGTAAAPALTAALAPKPFDYAPIYFPGTPALAHAGQITLDAGQERTGLAFALQRISTAVISGSISRSDGLPAGGVSLQMTAAAAPGLFGSDPPLVLNATSQADGTFSINQVTPGDYHLVARGAANPATSPAPAGGMITPGQSVASVWATTDLSVSGSDITGVALSLEPGLTIAGSLHFLSETRPAPTSLTQLRIALLPPRVASAAPGTPVTSLGFAPPITPRADGSFEIAGIGPGTYRLVVYGLDSTWWPQSALFAGRDLFDTDIEITRATTAGRLEVTFSDRQAELTGSVQTVGGSPASDLFVIVFPADRTTWSRSLRRTTAVRPDVDGRFAIGRLPPGDYLLAALADVDQDEWKNPDFLERVLPASLKISLGLGEKKVQNLKIAGKAP